MVSNVEHLSCAYWPTVYLLWKNDCLVSLLISKSNSFFFFLLLNCIMSLYMWDINPSLDISFANILHSVCRPYVLWMVTFTVVDVDKTGPQILIEDRGSHL